MTNPLDGTARAQRGSVFILSLTIVLVLAIIATAIINVAGNDRIAAGRLGLEERSRACAESGIQYGRAYFGAHYDQWNAWLAKGSNYRFDPAIDPRPTSLAGAPDGTRGRGDDGKLVDLDGDGNPDFWVTIHDDLDDRAAGRAAEDPYSDNNGVVWLRSECTNPAWALEAAGQRSTAVIEVLLAHVQQSSGYAQAGANAFDSGPAPAP